MVWADVGLRGFWADIGWNQDEQSCTGKIGLSSYMTFLLPQGLTALGHLARYFRKASLLVSLFSPMIGSMPKGQDGRTPGIRSNGYHGVLPFKRSGHARKIPGRIVESRDRYELSPPTPMQNQYYKLSEHVAWKELHLQAWRSLQTRSSPVTYTAELTFQSLLSSIRVALLLSGHSQAFDRKKCPKARLDDTASDAFLLRHKETRNAEIWLKCGSNTTSDFSWEALIAMKPREWSADE